MGLVRNYCFVLILLVSVKFHCKEIVNLPGLEMPVNFKQYSGYFRVSDAHFLHYWFVTSQGVPSQDPLLLWLNGGPGCSSIEGLLMELGPFTPRADSRTLAMNEHSWNKFANILFLEAPAGVGYSYSTDGPVNIGDDQTAEENYRALKQFFLEFPEFRKNDFYITGESYGGIYVPTLAVKVLNGMLNFNINLKGMAIGNGMLSFNMNTDTSMNFAFYHGLISEKEWAVLETSCCKGCTDTCDFHDASTAFCQSAVNDTQQRMWLSGLNPYDLYRDCYVEGEGVEIDHTKSLIKGLAHQAVVDKYLLLIKEKFGGEKIPESVGVPCINSTAMTSYMNREDVRKALQIPESLGKWETCSGPVNLHYTTEYENMSAQIHQALKAGLRILIYNGDTDMVCNFLMGQKFVSTLGLPIITPKSAWKTGVQIAGFITKYQNLDFVTIKGAGHMAPQWKPEASVDMMKNFLGISQLNLEF